MPTVLVVAPRGTRGGIHQTPAEQGATPVKAIIAKKERGR